MADLIALAHVIILVPNASYVTADAQSGSVTIYWSSSYKVLIARKAGSAVTDTPVNGTTYAAGNAMGASTVAYSGSVVETSFADTGLANGTTYYYKVFPKTTALIYAPGSAINSAPTSGSSGSPTWSYGTTATSMAPPGLDPWSNSVVLGSNDNNVHGMADSNGTRASGYTPLLTGGPIQSRPALLPASYRTPAGSGVNIVYVMSQDGFAYAVDTGTGAQVWKSPSLAASTMLQGGPGVWIQKLKSLSICGVTTSDVVFVGTRDTVTTTANKVYALNGSGGSVTTTAGFGGNCPAGATSVPAGGILWTYAGSGTGPCSTCMDIISSTPYVDYTNNVVWVTSRAAGNGTVQPSVWKINASNGTLAGGTATWIFNDVDSSPVPNADGAYIYVGTNAGTLKAIKVSDGTVATHTPVSTGPCNCTGALAIQGMPWPLSWVSASVGTPDTIIFSRSATVHSVNFNGSTFSANWTMTPTGAPTTVSAPVDDGANHLYIGASDGKVHQLDVATGTDQLQAPTTAISGTFGDPTFNWDISKIHVGATDGHTYTFTTPF